MFIGQRVLARIKVPGWVMCSPLRLWRKTQTKHGKELNDVAYFGIGVVDRPHSGFFISPRRTRKSIKLEQA